MLNKLLANIKAIAKYNRPKIFSKGSYFDKRWGMNSSPKKVSNNSEILVEDESTVRVVLDKQILVSFRSLLGKGNAQEQNQARESFIAKLRLESRSFIDEQTRLAEQSALEESVCKTAVIEKLVQMYEILQSYAYELNDAVGFGPLHVSATSPQWVTEVLRFDKNRRPELTLSNFRARLSTSSYSLVLRGDGLGIKVFVLPVARAMGLSRQENHYEPFGEIRASLENGRVEWTGTEAENLEALCMNAFSHLVSESKKQMSQVNLGELSHSLFEAALSEEASA